MKNFIKIPSLAILGFFIGSSTVLAANSNVGTSGAPFLKIGAGARPTAMGEAFTGIADDANAVYFNPAGLGFLEKPEITAMHTQWFQDMNYDFGAFVFPTEYGSWGLSAATLKVEDHERRGTDESYLGSFDQTDAAYGLSYGALFNNSLSYGITLRFIDQEIDTAGARTWSGDVGVLKKMNRFPLSMGLAIKHFGQKVKFNRESDPLPLSLDLGFGLDLFRDHLKMGLDLRHPRDNDPTVGLGGEWNQRLIGGVRAAARVGYNNASTDADGASGLSLGGGLGFKKFDLDFAWVPFGDLGNTFRYAALVKF